MPLLAPLGKDKDEKGNEEQEEDDIDALLDEPTDDSSMPATYRAQRIQQLHTDLVQARTQRSLGYGVYTVLSDEKALMDMVAVKGGPEAKAPAGSYFSIDDNKDQADDEGEGEGKNDDISAVVVHFFKPDFHRCRIMDHHLDVLARTHLHARFVGVHVESAPFLVERLAVKILPCVMAFVDGVRKDRIVGFEGLGGDGFRTVDLEARLVRARVLKRALLAYEAADKGGRSGGVQRGAASSKSLRDGHEDDDDNDWE